MSRDLNRIKRILNKLETAWMADPDLRLNQLIENIQWRATSTFGVPSYYLEDESFEKELDIYLNARTVSGCKS